MPNGLYIYLYPSVLPDKNHKLEMAFWDLSFRLITGRGAKNYLRIQLACGNREKI
jgi:hypothetical protein